MSKPVLWEANIDGWEDIAVESYQFVTEQGKERLEEEINESEAILSWAKYSKRDLLFGNIQK